MLSVNDVQPVLAALRERGIRIDKHFAPECRQLFGNAGIRANYCRKAGLGVDDVSELLSDRGFTTRRLDCAETLQLLETLLTAPVAVPPRIKARAAECDEMERKARAMRNRKYACPECGQLARGTRNSSLICGLCYDMHGEVIVMRRAAPLPEEIAAQAAGEVNS